MQNQRLTQKHHSERLTRARGVPDNTAFPPARRIAGIDTLNQALNPKHLLITRHDLADFFIKQREITRHFQQTLWADQADQHFVLLRDCQLTACNQIFVPSQIIRVTMAE